MGTGVTFGIDPKIPHTPVQGILPGCVQTKFSGSQHSPRDAIPSGVEAAKRTLWVDRTSAHPGDVERAWTEPTLKQETPSPVLQMGTWWLFKSHTKFKPTDLTLQSYPILLSLGPGFSAQA